MRLTSLVIENFRSITSLTIDFDPNITVILGQNNTGKTAILEAIACALDPRVGPRAQTPRFNVWDFRIDDQAQQQTKFSFTFLFKEATPGEWNQETVSSVGEAVQTEAGIAGAAGLKSIKLRVTGRLSGSKVDHDTEFLDLKDQVIASAKSAVSKLRKLRPAFYMPALRDPSREFARNATYWTPFIRDNTIGAAKRTQLENDIGKVNDDLIAAHTPFATAKKHLSTIGKTVDSNSNSDLRFEPFPPRLADLLGRTQVAATSPSGAWVPLERHGEGTQSTAVLLLFRAYCESQLAEAMDNDEASPIICIEEPEAHLHPHAAKALWAELMALPGQKIIATHSGDLVSRGFPTYLRRLQASTRTTGGSPGKITSLAVLTHGARAFQTRLRRGRGDLLFSRMWLLVEGETEVLLFEGIAEILDYDLDQLGIAIIPYREGLSIQPVIELADELGIAWFAVPDDDPQQGQTDQLHIRARPTFGTMGDIRVIPAHGAEEYLWDNGYEQAYEAMVTVHQRQSLPRPPSAYELYRSAVVKAATNTTSKPGAATIILARMKTTPTSIPAMLVSLIHDAVLFARRF